MLENCDNNNLLNNFKFDYLRQIKWQPKKR